MTHCKTFEGYDPPCTKENPCDMCEMNIELLRRDRRCVRLRALADGYRQQAILCTATMTPMAGRRYNERRRRQMTEVKAKGIAYERARIVAKARSYADVCERAGADMRWLRAFADEIEGGES